jgi:hypothetical protein
MLGKQLLTPTASEFTAEKTRARNPMPILFAAGPSGEHAKPALTAGMRKPLVILNAMLRNKTRWQTPVLATSSSTVSPLRAR